MPSHTVEITDRDHRFIQASIEEGRFSSTSEAVRAGLSLLERETAEEAAKLEWLRATTQKAFAALDRGEGVRLIPPDNIDSYIDSVLKNSSAEAHD